MKRFVVDTTTPDPELIAEASEALERGGIVAYPTDTLYALAVDPRSDEAVGRLFALKGRDSTAAIALIAADTEQAEQAGRMNEPERRLARDFWPGPLTIVLPASGSMSRLLSGDRGTIGVRVPAQPVARALASAFGTCITATSANPSGHPAPTTADEVAAAFQDRIDVLLDDGPAPGVLASTIVELVDGRPVLHRLGAVAWDRVLKSLQ
jgi:L-threonylcarbamoyladenylate synthase